MAFFGILYGTYFIGFIIFAFYAWLKLTARSEAPIVRRMKGFGYGLIWPFMVYRMFSEKKEAQASVELQSKRSQDLLD